MKTRSYNWGWPAVTLIACLLCSQVPADPTRDTVPAPHPGPSCSDTPCQIRLEQARLDELLLRFTEKHPDVIATRARLEELKMRRQLEQAGLICHRPIGGALLWAGVTKEQVEQAYRKAQGEFEQCMKQPGAVEGPPQPVSEALASPRTR